MKVEMLRSYDVQQMPLCHGSIFSDSSDVVNVTCFMESRGAFIVVVHLQNSLAEASKGNPLREKINQR